ncbi:COG1470 family protein [Thermus caldilimi]|uniref:COG1470 family protein n=1 Tax=Thermus caldilimi TaxID=2483360 RepID=UPI001075CED6|nr:hypothetical protein [Thermus caldilimi]
MRVVPSDKTLTASGVLELPEGMYEVQADPVQLSSGEVFVPSVEGSPAKVEYGKESRVRVVYALDRDTLPGTLVVVVEGLPQGAEASVRISGEGVDQSIKGTRQLSLPAGTYLLRAEPVGWAGERYVPTPTQEVVVLSPGGVISKTVTYTKEVRTGELLVRVEGLPSGLEARVLVKDGNGTTVASLLESRLLTLPAGVYFVEADPVDTYVPQVSGSPVQVQAGGQAEVRIVYEHRPASLSLSLEPASLTVPRGAAATLRATLTAQNFQGQVSLGLQGAPDGISLSPTTLQVNGTTQATLTLRVGASVAPDTYPIALTAQGQGVSASAGFSLVVPQPDFTFSLSPQSVSLSQGQSTTLIASVSPQNGFSGQVSFSLVNPPAGFSLSGGPVSPNGPTDVPLVLSVSASVAPGTYSLVVKAEGGGVSRTQTLSVQVSPTTGQLALSILFEGAPPGTEGYVVVSGPSGDQTVTRSQVLTLPPGTYTITAYAVVVNGMQYNPNPPGGTVAVQAGQTASFTITYKLPSGP